MTFNTKIYDSSLVVFSAIALLINNIFSIIIFAGIAVALYARIIEPYIFSTKKISIKATGIITPVKLIFISDLQVGFHKKSEWLKKLISRIIYKKPDLVIIGGDLISNERSVDESDILLTFKILSDKIKTIAVLGNHDYGRDYDLINNKGSQKYADRSNSVIKTLSAIGITVLRNESVTENSLTIYGVDDVWAGKAIWNNESLRGSDPLVVVSHNPDALLNYPGSGKKPDLVLSGHTHGGQVSLPFFGPLGDAKIRLGKEYYSGLKDYKGIPIYISKGLGESSLPIRFFTPPEILEISILP